jgi:dolichyl-phosphate-mannose-protein mannosyltransferase
MIEERDSKLFWAVMLALLLLTRLPLMASYLSVDNVNLAFSLEKFDPRIHQPQPPGYPFFVAFGKIVNFLFRDPERTFVAISILVSALCLPIVFLLTRRMFTPWAGAAATFLLLVNPVFWFSGLDGPLRPNLALFSLLTAYCCWRCWNGEKRFATWGALALGVGSGFRPDLLAFLLPLWLISTWLGTKSFRTIAAAGAVLAAVVLIWASATVIAMGGIQSFRETMIGYTVDQSQAESIVLGSGMLAWLRQVNRLVIWNILGLVTWIWAVPFCLKNRDGLSAIGSQTKFLFAWLVPGLIVQALVHVAAPGHTLFSVPAVCVVGGYVLSRVRSRDLMLASALVLNVMLFLNFLSLPVDAAAPAGQRAPSLMNAFLFGTFESSLGQVRWLDDVSRTSLKEIEELTPKDRPCMIITTDTYVNNWFMNWRIARYYLPNRDFWVLFSRGTSNGVQRIRRDAVVETIENNSVKLPISKGGRVLWLVEPDSEVFKQLASVYKLSGGRYVFFTDITADSPSITLKGVEIIPNGIQ